jgi:hypothetical protein
MSEYPDILSHSFTISTISINMLILKVLNVQEEELIKKKKLREVFMIWVFLKIEKDFLDGNLLKDHRMQKILTNIFRDLIKKEKNHLLIFQILEILLKDPIRKKLIMLKTRLLMD